MKQCPDFLQRLSKPRRLCFLDEHLFVNMYTNFDLVKNVNFKCANSTLKKNMEWGKTKLSLHFLHSGSHNTNCNGYFWMLSLYIFVVVVFVFVYHSPIKSRGERGTKQIKVPVLLFSETGFCCFRKLKRFLKTDNWT